jgi:hypothetical protein
MSLGDFKLADTIDFFFTTRRFSTGAPFQLAGSPVVSVYEDNSTTQITAGVTLDVDFDGVTGLNHVRLVLSGANGFETGKSYSAVITTGTVDSVSVVGEVVGQFTIERSAAYQLAVTIATYVDTEVAAIKAKTDNLPAAPAAVGDIPTAAAIADQVWDEAIAGHAAAGSTGEALSDAGAAGTPPTAAEVADAVWDEALAGHLGAGSTGEALDGAGGGGSAPTADEVADAVLKRDWTAVSGEASRSVLNALRFLRNKWDLAAGTLTVKKEDDSTTAWTAAVTQDGSATPVTGSDPS